MKLITQPSELYTTKEFREVRDYLIDKRANEKGETICEHCGKPIYLKYDIICHHIIEVDYQNMNNVEITLNEENLQLVHMRCHNQIHERFGCNTKKVYLVYGSPCSGKTTYVKGVAGKDDLVVDMDLLWQMISINPKYIKPNTLKPVVFAIRDELYQQIKRRNGTWHNAYIISGEPYVMNRKRICDELGANEIYIEATKEECLEHLYEDESRNFVQGEWEKYIVDFFNKYQPTSL